MTKKITLKDKSFDIKFTEDTTIDSVKYEKGSTHRLTLDNIDGELEVKHDEALPSGKITGELKLNKAKDQTTEPPKVKVEIKGKFDKGYFWDSFVIDEVKNTEKEETYKVDKYDLRTGADLLGLNYWGWGGVTLVLIAIGTIGYYWWTSYNKEEEEENI